MRLFIMSESNKKTVQVTHNQKEEQKEQQKQFLFFERMAVRVRIALKAFSAKIDAWKEMAQQRVSKDDNNQPVFIVTIDDLTSHQSDEKKQRTEELKIDVGMAFILDFAANDAIFDALNNDIVEATKNTIKNIEANSNLSEAQKKTMIENAEKIQSLCRCDDPESRLKFAAGVESEIARQGQDRVEQGQGYGIYEDPTCLRTALQRRAIYQINTTFYESLTLPQGEDSIPRGEHESLFSTDHSRFDVVAKSLNMSKDDLIEKYVTKPVEAILEKTKQSRPTWPQCESKGGDPRPDAFEVSQDALKEGPHDFSKEVNDMPKQDPESGSDNVTDYKKG